MLKFGPSAPRMASAVMRYGLSVLSVALALPVTLLLQHPFPTPLFFFLSIIVSAWLGGTGPGLLAVLLSALALDYFFLDPKLELAVSPRNLPHLIVFLLTALLVSSWSAARRRAEEALRRARDELEAKVIERTADLSRSNDQLRIEITERKRAEEERGQLLAREQASHAEAVGAQHRFRDLVNSIEGIVWEADAQTFRFLFVSQQAERILGYPVERWLSEPTFWKDHIHPDEREWAVEFCVAATAEKRDHELEYRMLAADGRSLWLRDLVTVVAEGDRATMLRGVMVDITERKRAEEERQAHLWFLESMDRVNRAIQGTDDLEQMMSDVLDTVLSIFDCDRAWLVYPCDPEAASWRAAMEHTRPDFPGAFALGVDLPMDAEVGKVFQAARASGGTVRFGPGSEHPVPAQLADTFSIQSVIGMAVYPKVDRPYMFGLHQCSYPRVWKPQEERLFQEIGRRMADALTSLLMFRNLRQSEARLEEAQRMAHVGYWNRDLDTDRVTWSDETYRIYGLAPQERTITFAGLQELIHPEDRRIVTQAVAEALRGGPRYDVEYRVVRPNGEVRIVHSQGDVTRESGRPRRMFGTVQDITEHKRAAEALRETQMELAHVNRVTTMGQLTASIAHEVSQPLTATVTNAHAAVRWLGAQPPDLEEARQALGRIVKDGKRAGDVIGRIRALIKKVPPRKDRLDMNESILEVIALTRNELLRNGVSLQTQLAKDLPLVHGDRIQLQQVILNLIINAIEAMSGVSGGSRELWISTGTDAANGVLVAVRDSGLGLDPQSLGHLFDAFYTTKPGGMGMGLSICRSIIEAHGGRVWATANVPQGAIFQFTLPAPPETMS